MHLKEMFFDLIENLWGCCVETVRKNGKLEKMLTFLSGK